MTDLVKLNELSCFAIILTSSVKFLNRFSSFQRSIIEYLECRSFHAPFKNKENSKPIREISKNLLSKIIDFPEKIFESDGKIFLKFEITINIRVTVNHILRNQRFRI